MTLHVYKEDTYRVLTRSNPNKDIAITEYNMLMEPVSDLSNLDLFIRMLKRESIDYVVAQVDTTVPSRFGERYKRAYSVFTESGEINRKDKGNNYGKK